MLYRVGEEELSSITSADLPPARTWVALCGVRLYLDAGKIARDGRLVRDGCHLKVRERLPLDRYLIWAADWKGAGLPSAVSTPRIFTAAANRAFNRLFEDRGCSLPDSV